MSRSPMTLRSPQTEPEANQTAILSAIVNDENNLNRTRFCPPRNLDENFMLGCLNGNEEFCAVRDSWRTSLSIVILPPAEFANLVDMNQVVFAGRLSDLAEAD